MSADRHTDEHRYIAHSRPTLDVKDRKAIVQVIRSGNITQGRIMERFEKAVADYVGVLGAVAVSSGTAALHLGLLALGIKEGDEVLLPSYVCSAPLNAVSYTGAAPQLCDIDLLDFNISVREAKKKATKRTKAIIVPHMFGLPANIDALLKLDIPLIEDCAHSIGATYRGQKVGSFGKFSIVSFYATKVITCGEGGMVLSDSKSLLEKVRDLRQYDGRETYRIRFNYKMSDMEAALGLTQLKKLPSLINKRKEIAVYYSRAFQSHFLQLPYRSKEKEHIFYRYVVRTDDDINEIITDLKERGIMCERPVFKPLHRYLKQRNFPHTEEAWRTSISIPLYPSLGKSEIQRVKRTITMYMRKA